MKHEGGKVQLSSSGVASLCLRIRWLRLLRLLVRLEPCRQHCQLWSAEESWEERVYRFNSELSVRKFPFFTLSLSLSLFFFQLSLKTSSFSPMLLLVARWLRATVQINTLDRYARGVSLRSAYVLTNARPVCRPGAIVAKSSWQFPDERAREKERERERERMHVHGR